MTTQFAWNKPRLATVGLATAIAPSYTIPAHGPPVDPVKAAIDELATVRDKSKQLAKREAELKAVLDCLAAGDHAGNKCKLVVTESWPERFDGKAFEADHPAVYAAYKRKADKPTRTLTIKALV